MPRALPSSTDRTLRQRRRARTRTEIASLALQLFEEGGYEGTSVEEIAHRALISPRTFYRYFPAKEEVVFAALPDADRELAELLAELGDLPLFEAVEQACLFLAERLSADADNLRRLSLVRSVPALSDRSSRGSRRTEEALEEALRTRIEAPGGRLHAGTLARAVVGAFDTAVSRWVAQGGRPPLTQLVSEALSALEPSLRAAARSSGLGA